MGKPIKIAVVANAAQARKELQGFSSGLSRSFGKIKAVAAVGAAAAGAALLKLGKDSVDAASDAQQSMGTTETVFGKAADKIIAKSKKAADQVGLSANQYRTAANIMGNSFLNAGIPMQKSIGWTDKLIARASDMHAAFGQTGDTVQTVTDAISAAMRGEYDSLERFGVQLSATKVERVANTLAMKKYGKELKALTPEQADAIKSQAVYNETMAQSSKVAGQFSKESDTLAGKQARLTAKFENAKAKLGAVLLPVAMEFTDLLADKAVPALEDFASWLDKNSGKIREWGAKLGAAGQTVASAVVPPLKTLGELALKLAGWLDGLPTPLKELAVQGALAAAVFPKIAGGFAALGGAATTGRAKLMQFAAEMTYAEQRAATLKGALSKIAGAAKTAAGPAGLLLLAQAATTSNDSLKTLANVGGGALAGFAVGGPIGAALGAAAGLILDLKQSADNAKDALRGMPGQQAIQGFVDYGEAIDQATGKLNKHAAAVALNKLREDGLLKPLQELGLGNRDVANAILGRAGAQERINTVLDREQSSIDTLNGRIEEQTRLRDEARRMAEKAGTALTINPYDKEIAKLKEEKAARQGVVDGLRAHVSDMKTSQRQTNENIAVNNVLTGSLKGLKGDWVAHVRAEGIEPGLAGVKKIADQYKLLPHEVVSLVKAAEIPLSLGQVKKLNKAYGLTPKQIKTVLKAEGIPATKKNISSVKKAAEGLDKTKVNMPGVPRGVKQASGKAEGEARKGGKGVKDGFEKTANKTKVNPGGFLKSISSMIRQGANTASKGGKDISTKVEKPIAQTKANLGQLRGSMASQMDSQRGAASSGGHGIGNALGSGIRAGIAATTASIAAQAAATVRAAINRAKAEARSKSPSKETMELGNDIGNGLEIGLKQTVPKNKKAGSKLARSVLKGVIDGLKGTEKAIDLIEKAIRKKIDGKNEKKREAKQLKKYQERFKKLKALGKLQDTLDSGNYLAKLKKTDALYKAMSRAGVKNLSEAKQRLADLKQESKDYAATVRDSLINMGDVTTLGKNDEDGTVSVSKLLGDMKAKVNSAKRFADLIRDLRAKGLNETALKQMLAAGPEAALATAEAIKYGGSDAIKQINQMQADLAKEGTTLGDGMAKEFFGAGVAAAEGIVKGLQDKRKELEKEATKLGKALLKAVKKALGIKSPSREMRKIMGQTVKGLEFAPHDGYVKRQGRTMARSLTTGFGEPAMQAHASQAQHTGQPLSVNVRLTAQQISQLERGREVALALDTYYAAGGRRRSL